MNFPGCRHEQRYEFILGMNYVTDKTVLDIGGDSGYGSRTLSALAKKVYCIDLKPFPKYPVLVPTFSKANLERITYVSQDVYKIEVSSCKGVVATCIEIFEHMSDPDHFVKQVATLCEEAFFTTPLAKVTGPTRNPEHVAEYSKEDFLRIVGKYFEVKEYYCQTADLRIVGEAEPAGDSLDMGHVVQMAWCKRVTA
jgi:2-polyprenyl-3-methyl-5-hydroxy-6-metoxy-1,4-benzoquinol methylase